MAVEESVKTYTHERLQRLVKEYPKLTAARVVLECERGWHIVEIHLTGKRVDMDAKARTRDVPHFLEI